MTTEQEERTPHYAYTNVASVVNIIAVAATVFAGVYLILKGSAARTDYQMIMVGTSVMVGGILGTLAFGVLLDISRNIRQLAEKE